MRDIFTSLGDDDNEEERFSRRISFDNAEPESRKSGDIFTYGSDAFEDFDTGREREEKQNDEDEIKKSLADIEIFERDYFSGRDNENHKAVYEIPHESTDDEFVRKSEKSKKTKKQKKNKSGGKSFVKVLLILIILLFFGLFCYAFIICGKINYQPDSHKKNEYINENMLYSDKKVYNILILGTDKRQSQESYRSDSMILMSIDKNNGKIKLTSFLRDSYVYIPAKKYSTKLNASCSFGGPQMVIDTIEYNFKTHIDKYVMIDFDVFKTIINDLGGVELTMTQAEADCITRESGYKCKSGTHIYSARKALWYARIRHLDSDFKRTDRQRKVILAVVDRIKKTNPITTAKMLQHVLPMIESDISRTELFKLGLSVFSYLTYDIEQLQIPLSGTWSNATINGQAVLKIDLDKNTAALKEFIYTDK